MKSLTSEFFRNQKYSNIDYSIYYIENLVSGNDLILRGILRQIWATIDGAGLCADDLKWIAKELKRTINGNS